MGEPEIADHEATHLMHSRRLHPAVKKNRGPLGSLDRMGRTGTVSH